MNKVEVKSIGKEVPNRGRTEYQRGEYRSWTSPAANTPATLVFVEPGVVTIYPSISTLSCVRVKACEMGFLLFFLLLLLTLDLNLIFLLLLINVVLEKMGKAWGKG